jgi:type II secretory pathway component PulK
MGSGRHRPGGDDRDDQCAEGVAMIPIRLIHPARGSALLAVLWMTVILTFVGMALAANVRSEVESTRLLAESEQGYFLARAGMEAALLRMTMPPSADPIQAQEENDFRQYEFQFATGTAHVEYRPASAMYNVNTATPAMLAALFIQLGLTDTAASALVDQLNNYRRPNHQKETLDLVSLDELLMLPGMTPELFYGSFTAGRRRPPLCEVLGVYGSGDTVNVNYAHVDLLAVLPGMTESLAEQLVAMRPIHKLDPRRVPPSISLDDSSEFSLIAHGRALVAPQQRSDIERVIRAVYVRDQKADLGARLIEWHDTN